MRIDTILIEASPGEVRAAMLAGGQVWQVALHRHAAPSRVGAIYLGRVRRVEPAMSAAFVDLGLDADGFLRARDVARAMGGGGKHARIERLVHEGAVIPVQVTADAWGAKGPTVTTALRLPGRFLHYRPASRGVLFPNGIRAQDRERIAAVLEPALTSEEGAVVQVSALDLGESMLANALTEELAELRARWAALEAHRAVAAAPACLDPGPAPVARLIAPHAHAGLARLVAGDHGSAAAASRWAERHAPELVERVEVWNRPESVFEAHGVEAEIEAALAPRVTLAGGGELVFEPGETLTAIDVNSAGFFGKAGSAARDVNLAAAPVLARQICLRGIAGAVVVDLLRMDTPRERDQVLRAMRRDLSEEPPGCHVLGLSHLRLLELTRRRRGPSLAEELQDPSPVPALRADAAAYAALRRVVREARPGGGATLAASPELVARLEGPLAEALAEASVVAGPVTLRAEPGWPRERAEVMIATKP